MALEPKQRGLLIGALIGAVLGAGMAYLLMIAPTDEEESKPITGKDLLALTGVAASLIRKVDDVRRKI